MSQPNSNVTFCHLMNQQHLSGNNGDIVVAPVLIAQFTMSFLTVMEHFQEFCQKSDITKKLLDDISRFLEYDAAIRAAIFLKEETIYICVNERKR